MPSYSTTSKERLATCHPDLQRLFNEVIKHYDCTIIEGHRDKATQNKAYNKGRSKVKWPYSNHNASPSNAVDVMPYYNTAPHIRWDVSIRRNERDLYEFAGFVRATAIHLGIKVRWGGKFKSFFDGPHWELI